MTTTLTTTLELPAWRGGQLMYPAGDTGLGTFTRIGLLLGAEPEDEAVDFLEQIVGYAWTVHMNGCAPISEGLVTVHDRFVVIDASPQGRRSRTRDVRTATIDLLTAIKVMYRDGSPLRRDGNRLVPRPQRDMPELIELYLGS